MDGMESIRNDIHDALDDVTSPRVSAERRVRALNKLENILASASVSKDTSDLEFIMGLQHTFECNIPSRLVPWLITCSSKLERLSGRAQPSDEEKHEASELSSQLLPALSLIQGIVLSHPPSKAFFGRERNLEILIDLLLASRHVSFPSSTDQTSNSSPTKTSSTGAAIYLTSVILDTLLCILVDSCSALRAFEVCNGVQVIVKILKRMGTPREVRMKCLEFLYFYLMDETTPTPQATPTSVEPTPPPTAPATPHHHSSQSQPQLQTGKKKKPFINSTPNLPMSMSRYGSSTYAFSSGSSGVTTSGSNPGSRSSSRPGSRSGSEGTTIFNPAEFIATSSTASGSRSVSSGSANSFSSSSTSTSSGSGTAGGGGTSTAPSSAASSPKKSAFISLPTIPSARDTSSNPVTTPPSSPPALKQAFVFEPRTPSQKHKQKGGKPFAHPHLQQTQTGGGQGQVQQRALNMLRRDVDFVPQSPQRGSYSSTGSQQGGEGGRRRLQGQGHARMRSGLGSISISSTLDGNDQEQEGEKTPKWTSKSTLEPDCDYGNGKMKTTEQKKQFLGTMLGNVDALVESVSKAGIWGLG
ncbi:hypothetical protein VKT23_001666 [Stygiomarasmius scandens]|uniref:Cell division control protein 14 n=1 Tax=Marasmiellus scandens TaxID=2682957 RepID=A0ABR1K0X8_9AGAR